MAVEEEESDPAAFSAAAAEAVSSFTASRLRRLIWRSSGDLWPLALAEKVVVDVIVVEEVILSFESIGSPDCPLLLLFENGSWTENEKASTFVCAAT